MNNKQEIEHDDPSQLCLPQGKKDIEANSTQVEPPLNFENGGHMIQKKELEGVIRNKSTLVDNPPDLELNNAQHELFLWKLKSGWFGQYDFVVSSLMEKEERIESEMTFRELETCSEHSMIDEPKREVWKRSKPSSNNQHEPQCENFPHHL